MKIIKTALYKKYKQKMFYCGDCGEGFSANSRTEQFCPKCNSRKIRRAEDNKKIINTGI